MKASFLVLLVVALLFLGPSSALAQQRDKFSAAEVKADLEYLYQTLKRLITTCT